MEFMDVINSRKSVRDYLGKPVEEEKLLKILEAARLAPSWANKQGCNYVVVKNRAAINELAWDFNSWIGEAPVILAACIDPKNSGSHNNMDYYLVDVGISMEHLVLAAADLGLGTCWIAGFDEAKAKKLLNIPEAVRVVALTPLGYPAPMSERSKTVREFVKASKRKSLQDLVHYEKW
jgi:nitroreductase